AEFAWNAIENVEQAIKDRQRILCQEQPFLANHPTFAGQSKDRHLVVEITGASVPSVVDIAEACQRGMKTRYAGCSAFFEPFDQGLTRPDAKPAEVKDLKLGPTPGMKSYNTLQGLEIVIKGRTHKNPDLQVVTAARFLPIVEAMNKLLEAGERQRAAL